MRWPCQVGLVVWASMACSKARPTPEPAPSAPIDASDVPSNGLAPGADGGPGSPVATVRLLSPGRMPRRALRYAWRVDRKERLSMELRTALSTQDDEAKPADVPLPAIHVTVDVDPLEVSPGGDLRYGWRVASSQVPATDPQLPSYLAQVAEGMRTEVGTVARLSGTAVVTSRGLATTVTVDPQSIGSGGGTGQMVEQMRQALRDLAAPFPEEEVGPGARWQKLSQLAEKDARVTQTDTFTLESLATDRGSLDDVFAQTAPPQSLHGPATPEGGQARMESMLGSGAAKTRFDLSRLVPQTTLDQTTTMVLSGQSPGDTSRRLTMVMRAGIVLSGSLR